MHWHKRPLLLEHRHAAVPQDPRLFAQRCYSGVVVAGHSPARSSMVPCWFSTHYIGRCLLLFVQACTGDRYVLDNTQQRSTEKVMQ